MRGKVVIAGVGQTKFGKLVGRTPVSMNVEACRKALNEAGVSKDEVDAVLVKYPTSKFQSKFGQTVAEALGIMPRIGGVWDQAGASGISMISFAAMAIEHGQCEVALVSRSYLTTASAFKPISAISLPFTSSTERLSSEAALSVKWVALVSPPGRTFITRFVAGAYRSIQSHLC